MTMLRDDLTDTALVLSGVPDPDVLAEKHPDIYAKVQRRVQKMVELGGDPQTLEAHPDRPNMLRMLAQ